MQPKNEQPKRRRIRCPSCHLACSVSSSVPPVFCPQCGYRLASSSTLDEQTRESQGSEPQSVSIIQGHEPKSEPIQFSIGPYQVLHSIGKGGMGEVLLAYDTNCGRRLALKRIRPDLLGYKNIQNRFLKEARVTSQLTHPSIIPIYTIHHEDELTYYTMPYVEGDTLKQILRRAKQQEKSGEKMEHAIGSIPALVRIFLNLCQAVAYAHSKLILHRDLKPENVIVGKYGEVMILDWGLAKLLSQPEDIEEDKIIAATHHVTQLGKVVGTVNYMAPERAQGASASISTDVYALGVILFQILTLKMPFKRGHLKDFRESYAKEVLQDPIEVAPYREIPKILSRITLKCLSPDPNERYASVDDLIHDLENYIEGRAEWFQAATVSPENKEDWEFQEHVLLAEHTAITRTPEITEWVHLMISRAPFAENIKMETSVYLEEQSHGIGFLFNVPESSERDLINEGYCLWLSSDPARPAKLLRSGSEISSMPDIFLEPKQWHHIQIKKVDNLIALSINDEEVFSYISRQPMIGTHIGLLLRDARYKMEPLKIYISSQNIMVNCLAIPDAFLANKNYHQALSEYRRIGYSFPGRAEGREAILRAGITLIAQAKSAQLPKDALYLYEAALTEFEKLHHTAGAPLEYLGKALVYEAQDDIEEEIKCYELALRRYPQHPLSHALREQILFRLMESSRTNRKATYHFLLLALGRIPDAILNPAIQKLIISLKQHWENLKFFHPQENGSRYDTMITLAFWLHKNYVLEEIIHELWNQKNPPHELLMNAFVALIVLNEKSIVEKLLTQLPKSVLLKEKQILGTLLNGELEIPPEYLELMLDKALDEGKANEVLDHLKGPLTPSLLARKIWALLLKKDYQTAGQEFQKIDVEHLSQESLLHFLYGLWLYATEGYDIAEAHWSSILDVPYPHTYTIGSLYMTGKLDTSWFKKAFDWERWQLQRQLDLFEKIKHQ